MKRLQIPILQRMHKQNKMLLEISLNIDLKSSKSHKDTKITIFYLKTKVNKMGRILYMFE